MSKCLQKLKKQLNLQTINFSKTKMKKMKNLIRMNNKSMNKKIRKTPWPTNLV